VGRRDGKIDACEHFSAKPTAMTMPTDRHQSRVERAERWALMEWILVGRRVWLLVGLLIAVAVASGLGVLYAESVSHLKPNQLRTFVQRQEETPEPRGPLLRKVHERQHE
jgi:hypothetical protein